MVTFGYTRSSVEAVSRVTIGMQLLNGDCLLEMQAIPNKTVDLILTDLPYGTTACKWDTIIPFEPLWAQYKRIIKDNGAIVLTASQPFTTVLISSNMSMFRYCWVWDKVLSSGFQNCRNIPLKQHEDIAVFYTNKPTYNPQMVKRDKVRISRQPKTISASNRMISTSREGETWELTHRYPTSILSFSNADRTKTNHTHPTQKPVALMVYLIKTYTNKGDMVLDSCIGSGTTGVACVNTDRNFIGIEKDVTIFEGAKKRIDAAVCERKQLLF